MRPLETCICLLACALGCAAQGLGAARGATGYQHRNYRFVAEFPLEELPFDDARARCGKKAYLLNLLDAEKTGPAYLENLGWTIGTPDYVIWLNLRVVEGFFHWLDPVPSLLQLRNDSGYGVFLDSFRLEHGCAVLNMSSGAIRTSACEERHRLVCIIDKMLQPVYISDGPVSTRMTFSRSPILPSYNLPDLELTCQAFFGNGTMLSRAELVSYGYTFVWTKNGVYLNHTESSLSPVQLRELNVYTHTIESSQGAYRCGVKALPSGNIIWSQVVNVVLEDFDTHLLTGDLLKKYTSMSINFISSDFWSFATKIGVALRGAGSNVSWSYSGITVDNNGGVKIGVFIYSKRHELASVAAGQQAEFNVTSAAGALQNIIINATIIDVLHCEHTLQGPYSFYSNRSIGFVESSPPCITESGQLVPRICSITFRSKPTWAAFDEAQCSAASSRHTVMCLPEVTTYNSGLQNTLTWPATPIGAIAIPNETCIQADGKPTVRRCEGNFTVGASWGVVQGSCEHRATQRTLDLRELSLELVTKETMDPTADRLQQLTSDSHSLVPQDVVYVATTLENIVSAGSISVQAAHDIASTINHVVKAHSQVLKQSRDANSTNRILEALEFASARLDSTGAPVVSGAVALAKVRRSEHSSRGVAIHLSEKRIYPFSDPASLSDGTDAAFILTEHWDTAAPFAGLAVTLMPSNALLQETTTDEAMPTNNSSTESLKLSSSILQLKYDSGAKKLSTENMSFTFYFKETRGFLPKSVECVFWDVDKNGQLGSWSRDGCEYGGKHDEFHVCNCTHLSSFAVIFKYSEMNPKRRAVHDAVLSYLTMTGVAVSATCLFMVVMTYVLFKKWRKGVGRKVLFNLCLSLLGALASFFALVALPKHRANPISCTCVGAALHYFILVSFAWTFVESLLQYLRFVRVLGTYVPKLVLKAAFGAWGIPLLVMLSVLILNPTQYRMRKGICWMDNEALLYTFLLPVGLILTANVVVFSVVVFSIYCRRQKGLRSTQSQVALAKAQLRAVVSIVFLLGLTWIFAYLSLLEEVSSEWGLLFEYLFVVTSSFQGLVIFLFHVAYEKTAREFWLEQIVYRIWPYSRNESSNQGSSNITL